LADDHIGPEHLLLGLLREDTTVAAAVLARHGVTIDLARAEVVRQSR
jgi:Clp amino terminal domain, pathogenicity island component